MTTSPSMTPVTKISCERLELTHFKKSTAPLLDLMQFVHRAKRTLFGGDRDAHKHYKFATLEVVNFQSDVCGSGKLARWHPNIAKKRQASTSGDVEEAVGGQQPSSRTATSAFVQGGTGGALPEPCKMTSSLQQATNVHVSAQTVRNRLHEGGMRARRPQVGVVLTAQHRAGRLAFAREHQDWQIRHWRPVLFTDESRFTLSTCDRRDRVWRRRGERSAACNILQHDRFGSGSVMVWGGISLGGRTALHVLARGSLTAIRYRDEILRPLVRPYAGAVGPGFLLMQDNARPHVAGVCQQFLQDEGIDAMDWPLPVSPVPQT
ncbi:hypothetical protein L3Q82_009119 [Scortum barcoo]|uniref:Uncharacterized protein n=1 Tax=Scortum barcoo TaxID=214431 RepID=A0ACB8XAQ0_9TELE|nr:hypothetical protein L3Q82_009119 [Scortum barcoo]